jgi:hypothetical protein
MNATVLLGTLLFPFVIGALFAKVRIYSIFAKLICRVKYTKLVCSLGILMLVIFHSFVESMFVAPFTAIGFICFFLYYEEKREYKKYSNFSRKSLNKYMVNSHVFLHDDLSEADICTQIPFANIFMAYYPMSYFFIYNKPNLYAYNENS